MFFSPREAVIEEEGKTTASEPTPAGTPAITEDNKVLRQAGASGLQDDASTGAAAPPTARPAAPAAKLPTQGSDPDAGAKAPVQVKPAASIEPPAQTRPAKQGGRAAAIVVTLIIVAILS